MKKWTTACFVFLMVISLPIHARAQDSLVPGGQLVGICVDDGKLCVAGFDSEIGQEATRAGVEIGDRIVAIDGKKITTMEDITYCLNHATGAVKLTLQRQNQELTVSLTPQITSHGPRLGLYLKQGITGVGTLTYYNPDDSSFGALGHGINGQNGKPVAITGGQVYDANVVSIRKGQAGHPGQLMGCVTNRTPRGTLTKNTPYGVFGKLNGFEKSLSLEVAEPKEVKTGKATIRSTVSGQTVEEYEVEIVKVYSAKQESGRNLLLKITDQRLLDLTGGIVQGMSGSPIIQDGKLVGAVTHVLVNDPTTGYGIFIENMLDAAA